MNIGKLSLEDAAFALAGNWQFFPAFTWSQRASDADRWAIIYTHNRNSDLLEVSNAHVINTALVPFMGGDVGEEVHSHWAVGWVEGRAIRVYRRGITKAFRVYHQLMQDMIAFPVLDELDYSDRIRAATLQNIESGRLRSYHLPENWARQVYRWLSENNCIALENVDDQGGYPDEKELRAACRALEYGEKHDYGEKHEYL